MNQPIDLKLAIGRFSQTSDGRTFQYHIAMQYGTEVWEVIRRFSEFDKLLCSLDESKYGCLPSLPPKTLGRMTDTEQATMRQSALEKILHILLERPDTRCSIQVRDFLETEKHVPSLNDVNLEPKVMRTFEDSRYSVSGMVPVPDHMMILAIHQDNSSLSRLGRVWSFVEPDELGVIHTWVHGDSGWERKDDTSCNDKPVCTVFSHYLQKIYIGMDSGHIKVVDVNPNTKQIKTLDTIAAHHKASVMDISFPNFNDCLYGKILSVGYDATMRVVDAVNHKLVCGGKLTKRIQEDAYLTSCFLDEEGERAFLGSNMFDVMILSIKTNPPEFLYHYKFPRTDMGLHTPISQGPNTLLPIPLDGRHVASIGRAGNTLAIAHSNVVSLFPFMAAGQESKQFEKKITDFTGHTASHIESCAIAPDRSIIVGGYASGAICIWNFESQIPICSVNGHEAGVSRVLWLDTNHPWGPALLTGGNEGKIHTWAFECDIFNDYKHWKADRSVAGMKNSDVRIVGKSSLVNIAAPKAAANPSYADPVPIRQGLVAQMSAYAPTLRQAGEEDSDDDLKGVF